MTNKSQRLTRSSANSAGYFIQVSGRPQPLLRLTDRDLHVNIIRACDYSSVRGRLKLGGGGGGGGEGGGSGAFPENHQL